MKKNIFLMFLVQGSNYILPLLTLPYLIRILGGEGFGKMAIILAFVQYAIIIVDYGFNFSATRLVAINKNNREKINEIYTVITTAKLLLLCLMYCICLGYGLTTSFSENFYYLLFGSISVIGTVFFPIWLFQGLEKMQGIAISTTIAKLCTLLCIFILVKKPEDIDKAILSQSLGSMLCAFISFVLIRKDNLARYKKIRFECVIASYKDGFDLFISNVTISFYTTLNVIIIGYFGGATLAGYFSAADKIRSAAQGVLSPVQQVIFPRVSMLIEQGMDLKNLIKVYGIKFIGFSLFITLSIILFGYPISLWYYGEQYRISSLMLLSMAVLPLVVGISIVYGQWWLVNIKKTAIIRRTYIYASLLHILLSILLMNLTLTFGVIMSVIITEVIIMCIFVIYSYKCSNLEKIK